MKVQSLCEALMETDEKSFEKFHKKKKEIFQKIGQF